MAALRHAEFLRILFRRDLNAQTRSHNFSVADELWNNLVDVVDRNGEADAAAKVPEGLRMAVFIPINRPELSSKGPPELPGLIAVLLLDDSRIGRSLDDSISRPGAWITIPTCHSLIETERIAEGVD